MAIVRNVVENDQCGENPADPRRMPADSSVQRMVLEATLNEVLATELACALHYRRYAFVTHRSLANRVKRRFLRHAQAHQEQADRIAERIVQLSGVPYVDPSDLAVRSRSRCAARAHLQDLLGEVLLFERTVIATYDGMAPYFDTHDFATARLLERIFAMHVEHAEELAGLLTGLTLPLQG